jgi:tetratricopeptide (TPR) repeat protein
LELDIAEENWVGSAADASNLSELYLTIGDVKQALDYAEQSVELADKSGENEYKVQSNTHLAYALHQSGNIPKAMDMFQKAEEFQKQFIPQAPFLILYLSGFYYCDLLLEQKKYDEVQLRATQTLGIVQKIGNLLAIALDNLSLGRALAMQTSEVFAKRTSEVLTHLNRAVDGLRQAGTQHELPKGLLARAEYYRVVGDFEKAKRDLDEAFAISTRGGMGLHLADCHLGYARLKIRAERSRSAEGKTTDDGQQTMNEAREHLRIAKEMIDRMGYHRRDKEVEELRAQIGDG